MVVRSGKREQQCFRIAESFGRVHDFRNHFDCQCDSDKNEQENRYIRHSFDNNSEFSTKSTRPSATGPAAFEMRLGISFLR